MHGRKLTRSEENKIVAGVSGGFAEYFGTDPILIRIIFIFLTFAGGAGILLYLLLWIFMPVESREHHGKELIHEVQNHANQSHRNVHVILGIFIILIGVVLLADNYLPFFTFSKIWPIFVILFGLVAALGLI